MADRTAKYRQVAEGHRLFEDGRKPGEFARLTEADELINDQSGHPHAFVVAYIMDRQIKADNAWGAPTG